MKSFTSRPVCELQVGQTLAHTQEVVMTAPVRGFSTSPNKMEIGLRKGNRVRLAVWNRNTLIAIQND